MAQLKTFFKKNDANFLPELCKTEGNEAVSLSTEGKQNPGLPHCRHFTIWATREVPENKTKKDNV